jgi:DNA-binding PadR family transcriptional regulator
MWNRVDIELGVPTSDMTTGKAGPLSVTDWIVLGLLVEEPRHGFAAARELKAGQPLGQIWTVQRPLVYRAFERLEAFTLIEPTHTERGDNGPQRTVFRATRAGRRRFAQWLDQVVDHPRDTRAELLAKLVFLARAARPRAPLARRQLDHFQPMTAGLQRAVDNAVATDRLIAQWRLQTLHAINSTLTAVVDEERVDEEWTDEERVNGEQP